MREAKVAPIPPPPSWRIQEPPELALLACPRRLPLQRRIDNVFSVRAEQGQTAVPERQRSCGAYPNDDGILTVAVGREIDTSRGRVPLPQLAAAQVAARVVAPGVYLPVGGERDKVVVVKGKVGNGNVGARSQPGGMFGDGAEAREDEVAD